MSFATKATLNSGAEIPTLGYGTWQSGPGEVALGIFEALKAGYRHLDLAKVYENQEDVAKGLAKAFREVPGLKREDIFITSKLWNNSHRPENVAPALEQTLRELNLEYLDLYLIHWPVAFPKTDDDALFPLTTQRSNEVVIDRGVSLVDTWKALIALPKAKVRAIGVSNFTAEHIQTLIEATGVVPAVNQVERHPLLLQDSLIKYAKEKNIHLTAYSALGNNTIGKPLLIEHPTIIKIAEEVGGSPAQVLLAWAQFGGHSVIPKSVTPSRIHANFKEVKLSSEHVAAVNKIGESPHRYNIPVNFNPKWDIAIWNEEDEQNATYQVIERIS